jgi:hypothetical protein
MDTAGGGNVGADQDMKPLDDGSLLVEDVLADVVVFP